MELKKKKSWRDVYINEYFELKDRLEDESLQEYDKIVIKIAFINNMTEDEVWSLKINKFRELQVEATWMDEFKINEKPKFKNINIGQYNCKIDTVMQNFTVAQYIDFQTFYPQRKTNPKVLGNIIGCFMIPEGKSYSEGYDVQDLVSTINEELDIMTANEILFFFLKQYLVSMMVTANYFNWQMKKMKKRLPIETYKEMEEKWETTKKAILLGLRS